MRASANEILKGVKPIFNMVPSKIELVCQSSERVVEKLYELTGPQGGFHC